MALQEGDTEITAERDEAREVADAAMRRLASRSEGFEGIHLADPRDPAIATAGVMWLAAEVRAARLDRACEVG
jgi:hypothetical protein